MPQIDTIKLFSDPAFKPNLPVISQTGAANIGGVTKGYLSMLIKRDQIKPDSRTDSGRAMFSFFGVLRIRVFAELSKCGYGPEVSTAFADQAIERAKELFSAKEDIESLLADPLFAILTFEANGNRTIPFPWRYSELKDKPPETIPNLRFPCDPSIIDVLEACHGYLYGDSHWGPADLIDE